MINEKLYSFSGFDHFLEGFQPRTSYGKKYKRDLTWISQVENFNMEHERNRSLITCIQQEPIQADTLEFHLSEIPELYQISTKEIRSELFNTRKFLIHYNQIRSVLNNRRRELFGLHYDPQYLLTVLQAGKEQDETFYISDRFDPELKEIRKKIAIINERLKRIKNELVEEIQNSLNLDFRFHDFLVINERDIPDDPKLLLNRETYDNHSLIVKPRLSNDYYKVHQEISTLLDQEKDLELKVLKNLSVEIEKHRDKLDGLINGISLLDIAMAKARLAIQFQCVEPIIQDSENISINLGRLIPLEKNCVEAKIPYTPLSAEFDAHHIIISGSNMGGKTVVLKTIVFLQLLTQFGFFVPVKHFKTMLFSHINLISTGWLNKERGLSSFGEEIMNLLSASNEGKVLYIIDEFAKATNSHEAFALNCALLESLTEHVNMWSISTTHLENLPELKNLSFWKVRGLSYNKYKEYFHSDFKGDLDQRIALINQFMDYGIEKRTDKQPSRDAVKIADLLGLDSKLIKNAENYLNKWEK